MGVDISTNGAEDFHRLASDLKRAGAKGIQKRLYAALGRSTKPAIAAARLSAASTLPSSGGKQTRRKRLATVGKVTIDGREYRRRRTVKLKGHKDTESLAQRVEQARYRTKAIKPKDGTVGIRVVAFAKSGKGVDLDRLDRGRLRHPLFGNRRHWFEQPVPPGWFSRPMERNADVVQNELKKAVAEIERDIEKGR